MRYGTRRLAVVGVGLCLSGFAAGAVFGQKVTSKETMSFEVIEVNGNKVVARNAGGAKEYTVPDDLRFEVGGKHLSVHELKPGMKGTVTVTTTTTTTPVYVTEVRNGEVVQVSPGAVTIRGENGYQQFTQGDIQKRNIEILRGGKPIEIAKLRTGDRISATIVTEGAPHVLSEREVQASLAADSVHKATPKAAAKASPSGGEKVAASTTTAESTSLAAKSSNKKMPKTLPKTASPLPLLGLIGWLSLALGLAAHRLRE